MNEFTIGKIIIWHGSISAAVALLLVLTSLAIRLKAGKVTPKSSKLMKYFYVSFVYFLISNFALATYMKSIIHSN